MKLFPIISSLLLIFISNSALAGKAWLIYERSELVDEALVDGDSFSIKALTGHTYLLKLHGVACPELNTRSQSKIAIQAKKFKVNEKSIPQWGQQAVDFVKDFLNQPFTVYTQKEKVSGSNSKNRYYAIIVNGEGKRLSEALLEAGLAYVDGEGAVWDEPFWSKAPADLPRKMKEGRYVTKLRIVQNKSKRNKVGIWGADQ